MRITCVCSEGTNCALNATHTCDSEHNCYEKKKNSTVPQSYRMTPLDLGVKLFEDKARNLTDLCLPRASESITRPSSVILLPFRLSLQHTHQSLSTQHACSSTLVKGRCFCAQNTQIYLYTRAVLGMNGTNKSQDKQKQCISTRAGVGGAETCKNCATK